MSNSNVVRTKDAFFETYPLISLPSDDPFDQESDLNISRGRRLDEEEEVEDNKPWEIAFTSMVIFLMFAALISDRFGADSVMLTAMMAFLLAQIITVQEGLQGFANEGLWAVMMLFVVVEGIGKTGALDWYMSKLLGHPTSLASAQLRVLVPVAILSAFVNNTPIVVVMIPIIQRWAKNVRQPIQQLLIPLSFASILGGTCTLIGTSTNLVVTGLLEGRYTGSDSINIGLFDLGQYGVPVAMAGLAYILLASPILLSGNRETTDADEADDLLLGARLTQWSPAVNRTVQRSGLRDTGGIYLVSVQRAATGHVHRAVSKDFVLNVGDILYFTGHNVEHFGDFCADNGLEVMTNEILPSRQLGSSVRQILDNPDTNECSSRSRGDLSFSEKWSNEEKNSNKVDMDQTQSISKQQNDNIPESVGCTKESLLTADHDELIQSINHMSDMIRSANTSKSQRNLPLPEIVSGSTTANTGLASTGSRPHHSDVVNGAIRLKPSYQVATVDGSHPSDPPKIIVTIEKDLVLVGINARDRSGLLLDISKGLLRLDLHLHHTEAAIVGERSLSIWRCQIAGMEIPDVEEIWSVLNALLSADAGVEAIKKRGLRVIRATVVKGSRLIGKTITEVNFRSLYKAAIVSLRQAGINVPPANFSTARLDVGDILILQTSDDSPLLTQPPPSFYQNLEKTLTEQERSSQLEQHYQYYTSFTGVQSLVNFILPRRVNENISIAADPVMGEGGDEETGLPECSNQTKNTDDMQPTTMQPGAASSIGQSHTPKSVLSPLLNSSGEAQTTQEIFEDDRSSSLREAHEEQKQFKILAAEACIERLDDGLISTEQKLGDSEIKHYQEIWKDMVVLFRDTSGVSQGTTNGGKGSREFLTAMTVVPGSKFVGKSVAEAGIHKLPELFLVSIERPRLPADGQQSSLCFNPNTKTRSSGQKKRFSNIKRHGHDNEPKLNQQQNSHEDDSANTVDGNQDFQSVRTDHVAFDAIDPDELLEVGDVLWFSGSASAVGDLRKIPGLAQYQSEEVEKIDDRVYDRRLVQAVVARNGPLVGHTVKELQFRTRYGAAVIAVHREGKRVHEHPGRIKLHAGDVLLLEGGPSFLGKTFENDRAFALLAEVKDSAPPRLALLIPALVIVVAMLAVFMSGVTTIFICALVASVLMVVFGILSEQEARDAFKWDIFITIAAAFGIGKAMVNSGVAGGIANFLVDIGESLGIGDAGLLGAVYFATFLISNVVTNNAAAALLFPIAMDAAEQTGIDRVIMSYALMLGASASFMSPFGYTTNLLIYGPGGYKYNDFLRFGAPMQVILWILSTVLLVTGEQWYICWAAMFLVLLLVSCFRLMATSRSPSRGNSGVADKVTAAASSSTSTS